MKIFNTLSRYFHTKAGRIDCVRLFPKPARVKPTSGSDKKRPEGHNDTGVTVTDLIKSWDSNPSKVPLPP